VIYTSGSTGKPKGVCISHYNACHLSQSWSGYLDKEDLSGVLFWTNISFDGSVFEVFVPLLNGGTILAVDSIFNIPYRSFFDNITLINTVPSVLRLYLQKHKLPPGLKTITIGGEIFPNDLIKDLTALNLNIFNVYGPTEDTVHSTFNLIFNRK